MASLTSISDCSFSLLQHHARAYELSIDFTDSTGTCVSRKQVQFIQAAAPKEEQLWDIASINGRCSDSPLSTAFSKGDRKDLNASLGYLTASGATGPVIVVLDLQDAHKQYVCAECPDGSIAAAEDAICDFFHSPSASAEMPTTARKIHEAFQAVHPVDFVLREGSLKRDLLKSGLFSESEVAFFQTKGQGSIGFCQSAEFFMNAVKLGDYARSTAGDFPIDKYVSCVAKEPAAFGPYKKSSVLYPPLYKDIYAIEGAYARTLSSVFAVEGAFDPASGITTMHVGAKV